MFMPPSVGVPVAVSLAAGAAACWGFELRRRSAPAYQAILGNPRFRWLLIGFSGVLFVDFAAFFWMLPFAQRRYGLSAAAVGAQLGAWTIGAGIAGALLGGVIADRWHRRTAAGRVWTVLIAVICETIAILVALRQPQYALFVPAFAAMCLASGVWTGITAVMGLDLVPREHHGAAVSVYFLVTTLFGPGLGPFIAGLLSDQLGSIATALSWCCLPILLATLAFVRLGRSLTSDYR